jgi:hypothetical protein
MGDPCHVFFSSSFHPIQKTRKHLESAGMLLCFPSTLKSGAPAWLLPGHFHKTQVILWCHIRLKRDQQILIP